MPLHTQAMPGLRVNSFEELLSCSEQAQYDVLLRKDAVLAMLTLCCYCRRDKRQRRQ